jgi:hypothetical protein
MPRFAAELIQQAHGFDHHAAIHGFRYIVNGEQGDGNALISKELKILIPWLCLSNWTGFGQNLHKIWTRKMPKKAYIIRFQQMQ